MKIVNTTNHISPIELGYKHDKFLKIKNSDVITTDGYVFSTSNLVKNISDLKSNKKSNLYLTSSQTIHDFILDDSRVFDKEFSTSMSETSSTNFVQVSAGELIIRDESISGSQLFIFEKYIDDSYYIKWFDGTVLTIDNSEIVLSAQSLVPLSSQLFDINIHTSNFAQIETQDNNYLGISDISLTENTIIITPTPYDFYLRDYTPPYIADGFSSRSNEWVVYHNNLNTPTLNKTTEINFDNSISGIQQNYIVNFPYETNLNGLTADIEFFGLKNIKHVESEYSYVPVNGEFTNAPDNLKIRDYDKLYTGSIQDGGLENIHLSYQTDYAKAITFSPDKVTYFHYPEQAPLTPLSSVALEYNGAFAGETPMTSDRIYKKMANYKKHIYWGDTNQWQTGVWLCSWLSGATNSTEPPVWMDRWYFPGFVTYSGALVETSISHVPTGSYVWDEPSIMTFEPGVWYKYVKFGEDSNDFIVESLNGDDNKNLKLYFNKWGATTEDNSIYNNDGIISKWSDEKLTVMDLEFNPKQDNYALELDGDTSVVVPYSESITPDENFSVNFWVYSDDWANAKSTPIIGNYYRGGWRIGYTNNFSNPIVYTFDPTYGHVIPYGLEGKIFGDHLLLEDSLSASTPVSIAVDYNHYAYLLEWETNSLYKMDYDGVVLRENKQNDSVIPYIELGEYNGYDVVYTKSLSSNVVSAFEINCLSSVGTLTGEMFSFDSDDLVVTVDEFTNVSGSEIILPAVPLFNTQIYINGILQSKEHAYNSGNRIIFRDIVLNDDYVHLIQSPLIPEQIDFSGNIYTIPTVPIIIDGEEVDIDYNYNGDYLVFINGLLQDSSVYTVIGEKTIEFHVDLDLDTIVLPPLYTKYEFLNFSGTQLVLAPSQDISRGVAVYINGVLQSPSFYSITLPSTIDFSEILENDIVHVVTHLEGAASLTPWCKHFTVTHTDNNPIVYITQFGKKIIVDNNDVPWEILNTKLYKGGLPWVTPSTSEEIYNTIDHKWSDIVCDKDNNIWGITENGRFYKFDNNGNMLFNYSINNSSTNWTIGLTHEYVKPSTNVCDFIPGLTSGSYYTFIHFNANSTSTRYVYTPNGEYIRKYNPLDAVDISKSPNDNKYEMRFSVYGDFSGYEYHRKFRYLRNNKQPQFYVEYDYFRDGDEVPRTARNYYSPAIMLNTWQQIGFTFDYENSRSLLYINAKLEDETQHDPGTFIYQRQNLPIMIGDLGGVQGGINNQFGNRGHAFEGKIADVRIYDGVINASDLKHLYLTKFNFQEITWAMPTGEQNILEEVERFFKHKLPGMKSQYFNLHIKGINYSEDTKDILENAIKQAVYKITPAYTELYNIIWDDDTSGTNNDSDIPDPAPVPVPTTYIQTLPGITVGGYPDPGDAETSERCSALDFIWNGDYNGGSSVLYFWFDDIDLSDNQGSITYILQKETTQSVWTSASFTPLPGTLHHEPYIEINATDTVNAGWGEVRGGVILDPGKYRIIYLNGSTSLSTYSSSVNIWNREGEELDIINRSYGPVMGREYLKPVINNTDEIYKVDGCSNFIDCPYYCISNVDDIENRTCVQLCDIDDLPAGYVILSGPHGDLLSCGVACSALVYPNYLIAGDFTTVTDVSSVTGNNDNIMVLNNDFTINTSYIKNNLVNLGGVQSIYNIQINGIDKILLSAGRPGYELSLPGFRTVDSTSEGLVLLNQDLTVDTNFSFLPNSSFRLLGHTLYSSDGFIYQGLRTSSIECWDGTFKEATGLVRLDMNGKADPDFFIRTYNFNYGDPYNSPALYITDDPYDSNYIIITGLFNRVIDINSVQQSVSQIAKINRNTGEFHPTFSAGNHTQPLSFEPGYSSQYIPRVNGIIGDGNGGYIICGYFSTSSAVVLGSTVRVQTMGVARIFEDGTNDLSWTPNTKAYGNFPLGIDKIIPQDDGYILYANDNIYDISDVNYRYVCKISNFGIIDPSYKIDWNDTFLFENINNSFFMGYTGGLVNGSQLAPSDFLQTDIGWNVIANPKLSLNGNTYDILDMSRIYSNSILNGS